MDVGAALARTPLGACFWRPTVEVEETDESRGVEEGLAGGAIVEGAMILLVRSPGWPCATANGAMRSREPNEAPQRPAAASGYRRIKVPQPRETEEESLW